MEQTALWVGSSSRVQETRALGKASVKFLYLFCFQMYPKKGIAMSMRDYFDVVMFFVSLGVSVPPPHYLHLLYTQKCQP